MAESRDNTSSYGYLESSDDDMDYLEHEQPPPGNWDYHNGPNYSESISNSGDSSYSYGGIHSSSNRGSRCGGRGWFSGRSDISKYTYGINLEGHFGIRSLGGLSNTSSYDSSLDHLENHGGLTRASQRGFSSSSLYASDERSMNPGGVNRGYQDDPLGETLSHQVGNQSGPRRRRRGPSRENRSGHAVNAGGSRGGRGGHTRNRGGRRKDQGDLPRETQGEYVWSHHSSESQGSPQRENRGFHRGSGHSPSTTEGEHFIPRVNQRYSSREKSHGSHLTRNEGGRIPGHHSTEGGATRECQIHKTRSRNRNSANNSDIPKGATEKSQSSMHQKYVITEDELEAYSQTTAEEVLHFACHNEKAFLGTFRKKYFCNHPLRLKQLIKLLYLLVESEKTNRSFVSVKLAEIFSTDDDNDGLIAAIEKMLKKILKDTRSFVVTENVLCLRQLVCIGLVAIRSVPSAVLFTYPVPAIEQAAKDMRQIGQNVDNIFEALETLKDEFEEAKENLLIKKKLKQLGSVCLGEPPQPFTDIPILPTLQELTIMSKQVYLRPNIVSGGYDSWDHYFDIQFRLLREDFVRPLREGIAAYYNSGSTRGISDIRVYHNTRLLNPVCLKSGMGFEIKFDASNFKNFKWEHSRRLIFGSLLCLSDDNFREHVMFATVVKREPNFLKEGLLTVKFEDNTNPFSIDSSTVFTMVESTAYFEAYRYILERLQRLSKSPDKMPMRNYIVDANYNDSVDIPAFLNMPTNPPVFDLNGIIEMKRTCSRRTNLTFDVTNEFQWPQSHATELDSSQLKALKMSLTQEMAVIQGPPGTGKTFIGLKIAEAYLRNRNVWDPKRSSPILVVCYTNHALDQFLEGIQETASDDITIIRIGGRSKSKDLSNCLLREHVLKARAERSIPGKLFGHSKDAQAKLAEFRSKIESKMKHCDAEAKNSIIQLSVLDDCVSGFHAEQLLYGRPTEQGKEMEVWLELWYPEETQQSPTYQTEQATYESFESEESNDEDSYIDVDYEAHLLEDDRMIDGEELTLPRRAHIQKTPPPTIKRAEKRKDEDSWSVIQLPERKRNQLIQKGFSNVPMTDEETRRVHDIWHLPIQQRWRLYLYWMNQYTSRCRSQISEVIENYNDACIKYNEVQRRIECYVAEKADVIGMTTTGAAKYHHLLDGLHPKIAIFEEAAEVLEAHLVTSIASSVQQVILIGDHKQLRPKPTCYRLEKDYKLGVSLFERLVDPQGSDISSIQNMFGLREFPFVTLQVQHRMRPEISKLIHPSIYKSLTDAENVKLYGHVKGISKDLFFVCHREPEEDNSCGDSKSHVNKYEAEYSVQLCLYLLKQGYPPEEITILTMYRGQLLELKHRMKRKDFQGVRVAAVDDFQGEENEIIILSLVRSTSSSPRENRIGFLEIQNRVCVSLSRAKKGLYIIGNGHLLKERIDTKWPQIIQYLEEEKLYGKHLKLYCQNHPKDEKIIEKLSDFQSRPEGGCQRECSQRLTCGHSCPRLCHISDSEHESVVCTKTCGKPLNCGHFCQGKCLQCKKNKKCKPCTHRVEKKLPCGHQIQANCSADVHSISCPKPCGKYLPCGHTCKNLCSELCTSNCTQKVLKKLRCGHHTEVECYKIPEDVLCSHPCEAILDCGDVCTGTCGQCKQGRLHVQCKTKCGRTLECGHKCDFPCPASCPPCSKPCNNSCSHNKCPKKCFEPCKPCMEKCEWSCQHLQCSKPCGELCDRPHCDKPCSKTLECEHPCIGLCGEPCPTKCRVCDKEELFTVVLGHEEEEEKVARYIQLQDCNHVFEVSYLDLWMSTDTTESIVGEEIIKFKHCPTCSTPIRKSLRYGNSIKKVLIAMNAVKEKELTKSACLSDILRKATDEMKDLPNQFMRSDILAIKKEVENSGVVLNPFRARNINFQVSLLPTLQHLKMIIDEQGVSIQVGSYGAVIAEKDLVDLKNFLLQRFLLSQQCSDVNFELRRISCSIKLLDLYSKLMTVSPSQQDLNFIATIIGKLNKTSPNIGKVTEKDEDKYLRYIKQYGKKYNIIGLMEDRSENVTAVGNFHARNMDTAWHASDAANFKEF